MTEYVILTDSELGHKVICPRSVAEDFLKEFEDINDDIVYIEENIHTFDCLHTVNELKEEYDFAITIMQEKLY